MDVLRYLIAGLGNPGVRYENTWHNLGAEVVKVLAHDWKVVLRTGRGDYWYGEKELDDKKIMLVIPTSYMNRSGQPISQLVRYFKISLENVLIVYDDHDLPLGRIRLRSKGSSGGHRGMEDIILRLGSEGVPRLKIGIRLDSHREAEDLAQHVLSPIPARLRGSVEEVLRVSSDAVVKFIYDGIVVAGNEFNYNEIV